MLSINGTNFEFSNMGLFASDGEWIHPTVTVPTYELIYAVSGVIHLREENRQYTLHRGEMLLLDANREHGGTAVSREPTSFYWLHFHTDHIKLFPLSKQFTPPEGIRRSLAELMHLQDTDHTLAEITLAKLLLELSAPHELGSRRAHEITEFIRIHANRPITVGEVARRFGYSADHLSRLLKQEFGYDTKTAIVKKRLDHIESMLVNTDHSIKEIAYACGFEDENKFVKFFRYHEGTTPTEFRRRYFRVHMNDK